MQYKVPQNVDIEDKVIGPLTIRQFIIVLIAAGILLVLNFVLIGPLRIFFYLFAAIIGSIAGALVFVKYGDQNAEVFILSAWKTFASPRQRVWQKEEIKPEAAKEEPLPVKQEPEEKRTNISEAKEGLDKLAELVDTGGYSSLSGERMANFNSAQNSIPLEEDEAKDFIGEANQEGSVDKIIESTKSVAPKREKLVSEIASVPPDKRFEEEPKIIKRNPRR